MENNAIDITFELIKDFPTPVMPLKSTGVSNTSVNSNQEIPIKNSLPVEQKSENIIYSENEIVDRIIKEAEKSNLNFIVNNNISEGVLKELDKLNTMKVKKEKNKKNVKSKQPEVEEEILDPPTLLSKSTIINANVKLAEV